MGHFATSLMKAVWLAKPPAKAAAMPTLATPACSGLYSIEVSRLTSASWVLTVQTPTILTSTLKSAWRRQLAHPAI